MTVPSERYSNIEIITCPNCGSQNMIEKWVDKYHKNERREISMNEKVETVKSSDAPQPYGGVYGNIICGGFISIPVQYVLTCKECGYTVVKTL